MEKLGWEAKIDSLYLLGDISGALMPFQTSAFQQDQYTVLFIISQEHQRQTEYLKKKRKKKNYVTAVFEAKKLSQNRLIRDICLFATKALQWFEM